MPQRGPQALSWWLRRSAAAWLCRLYVVPALAMLGFASTFGASSAQAFPYQLSYAGRLTDSSGAPVAGPIDIRVDFYTDPSSAGSRINVDPVAMSGVTLSDGVFQLNLALTPAEFQQIFAVDTTSVFIQVTDTTHNKTYARQAFNTAPYALKIPIDENAFTYNGNGALALNTASAPQAGQVLTTDGSGKLTWTTLANATLSATAPTSGQVLQYNGSQWVAATATAGGTTTGGVTSVSVTAPLSVATPTTTPQISMTQATSVSAGYLAAADWIGFKNALSQSGGTMTGALNLGSQALTGLKPPSLATDAATKTYVDTALATSSAGFLAASGTVPLTGNWSVGGKDITGIGNVGVSPTKTLSLGTFDNSTEPTLVATLGASDKGKTWFNLTTNQVKYWDGSNAQALGTSGAGLNNLNGLVSSTQLLNVTAGGSALAWSSTGSTHTLELPLASVAGVSAGLVSNADYASFAGKLSAVSAGTGLTATGGSGTVTLSLASVGSSGTYTKVTTNAQGQVTSGAPLIAADIPALNVSALTAGTLPVALGGTGMGTVPAAGKLLVGNGSGYTLSSLEEGATGGVTVADSAGTITLDTAQDIRTTASPVFTGLQLSGVPSSLLKTTSAGVISTATGTDITTALGYTPVNKAGDTLSGGLSLGALTSRGLATPAVSPANSGVIYFDSASSEFKFSQNGSSYAPLATGGSVTSVMTGTGLSGGPITTSGTLSLATVGTAGTYVKVSTDAYGRVTGSTTLATSDIPPLAASVIATGTFNANQIPPLPATILASGTVNLAQIPALPASQITSGNFNVAQIPSLPATQLTSGTVNLAQIPALPATQLTSGTINLAQIPGLPATQLTSGIVNLAQIPALPATQLTSGTINLLQMPGLPATQLTSGTVNLLQIPGLPATQLTSGTINLAQMPSLSAAQLTSGTINLAQIPSLPASRLTSGTLNLAQVPNLPASQITTGSFALAQIPSLPASQITTGSFALGQIPALPATQITSGSFALTQIPALPAAQITSGSFAAAQIPSLPATQLSSGTVNLAQIPGLPASQITSGTFNAAQIPTLSTSQITSGTLSTTYGGTGVSSTATFPLTGVVVTETASETLTNKTLTAATINGAASIGGSTVIATTGTLNSAAATVAGNLTVQGNGSTANKLILNDKGAANYLALKAPDTLTGSTLWVLPGADGTSGQVLTTNGSGTLTWGAASTGFGSPIGAAGGELSGNYPNPNLATTGITAGVYTKLTVDAKGRASAGTTLSASDIPTLPASIIGGIGTIGVPNGGTGASSFSANGVLFGNNGGNLLSTAQGSPYNVLTVGTSNVPTFGPVNLATAAAVSGILPTANGGTGVATPPTSGQLLIGNGAGYTLAALAQGPTQSVAIVNTSGAIALDTAQDIRTTASPNFAGLTVTSVPASLLKTSVQGNIVAAGPTDLTNTLGFIPVNKAGDTLTGGLSLLGPLTERGTGTAALSAVGQGVLYFNSALGHFQISENGSGFSQLASALSAVSSVASGSGLIGGPITTSGTLSLATVGTAGVYTKVVTDAYGRVIGATTLAAADIPPLAANSITSGSFTVAQIPPLPASIVTSGSFAVAQIPALPASIITTGAFAVAQIPTLPASIITTGTLALSTVPSLPASVLTSGTLNIAQLPSHSAALITSGTLLPSVLPNLAGSYVALAGSTMTGPLILPVNGLAAGTSQFVLTNGNVGIGTTTPAGKLDIAGAICINGANCITSWPGSGTAAVSSVTAGAGLIGGTITSNGSISLPSVVTAGAYAKVITDSYGRVIASTTLLTSDLPAVNATTITTGTLGVANGGTGVNSFTTNGVVIGGPMLSATAVGSQFNVLTAGSGGVPGFSQVNLASTAAVTGILPVANGGTGVTTGSSNLMFATPNGFSGAPSLRALAAADLPAHSAALITSGTLLVANGGTGLSTVPSFGQFPIGTNTGFAMGSITAGAGITITNAAGSITVASAATSTNFVAVSGSTMSGYLTLPANGLIVGTSELLVANGNVGIGTTIPAGKLDVAGSICFNGANCITSWPGGGTTAVSSVIAGAGLIGGTITSSGSISLPSVVTAGSYAKVITDSYGRVVGSTTLAASDLPPVNATTGISGTLAVANGGTGANTFTSNGLLVGAGSLPLSTVSGSQYNVLTAGSGGAPGFGQVNLASVAAVTGILPVANGGTGFASGGANLFFGTPSSASGIPSMRLLTAPDLPSHSASLITSGTLPVNYGGTGLNAAPAVGQFPIGTGTTFALGTITAGNGITVTNTSGTITVAATASPTNFVAVAGSTMTGVLILPADKLFVGTNEFVVANGNVGIGTALPLASLDVQESGAPAASINVSGTGIGAAGGGHFFGRAVHGSESTPAQTVAGDVLATFGGEGVLSGGALTTTAAASLVVQAEQPWTTTNQAASASIYTTPLNTTIPMQSVYFSPAGNVGINTSSPISTLTMIGNASGTSVTESSGGKMFQITTGNNGQSLYMSYDGTGQYGFVEASHTNVFDPLVLQPRGGNVGIGTTNPMGALDVGPSGAICLGGTCKTGWPAATGQWTNGASSSIFNNNAGNVGIGSSSPTATLDVIPSTSGSPALKSTTLSLGNSGATYSYFGDNIYYSGGYPKVLQSGASAFLQFFNGSIYLNTGNGSASGGAFTGGSAISILQTGHIGIYNASPTYDLDITGDMRVTGCYRNGSGTANIVNGTCASDQRLKKDIKPITGALARFSAIEPVTYRYRASEFPGRGFGDEIESGFIAQKLKMVYPELVSTGADGYYRVSYDLRLEMETIAAIRELKDEKDTQIAELKAELDASRIEANQLKTAFCSKFPETDFCH